MIISRVLSSLVVSSMFTVGACDDDPVRGVDAGADVDPDVVIPGPDTAGPDVVGPFPEAPPSGFTLHDLGDLATLDGESEDFTFDVPEGAVSLHVTLTSHPALDRTSAAALAFSERRSASRTRLPTPTRRAMAWPI